MQADLALLQDAKFWKLRCCAVAVNGVYITHIHVLVTLSGMPGKTASLTNLRKIIPVKIAPKRSPGALHTRGT